MDWMRLVFDIFFFVKNRFLFLNAFYLVVGLGYYVVFYSDSFEEILVVVIFDFCF
jgi:hypothetical protein